MKNFVQLLTYINQIITYTPIILTGSINRIIVNFA